MEAKAHCPSCRSRDPRKSFLASFLRDSGLRGGEGNRRPGRFCCVREDRKIYGCVAVELEVGLGVCDDEVEAEIDASGKGICPGRGSSGLGFSLLLFREVRTYYLSS